MWGLLAAVAAVALAQPEVPVAKPLDEIRIRDPFVLPVRETGTYYLYGTGGPPGQPGSYVYQSRDLKTWTGPEPVFRAPEDYWGQRDFWAPEVHAYRGRYYMFITFSPAGEGPRGTAVLVSDRPDGPFVPHSDGPVTPGGWFALDGTLFVDMDGAPWLVFCHEWIQIGDGALCAVRLAEDLSRAESEPVTLFHASDAAWGVESRFDGKRGRVTDGLWLHRCGDGGLLMLWSTFGAGGLYTVGSARSASGAVTGPWSVDGAPIFTRDGGHPMLFRSFDGTLMMALHQPNRRPDERARFLEVAIDGGGIRVLEPSADLQQAP